MNSPAQPSYALPHGEFWPPRNPTVAVILGAITALSAVAAVFLVLVITGAVTLPASTGGSAPKSTPSPSRRVLPTPSATHAPAPTPAPAVTR